MRGYLKPDILNSYSKEMHFLEIKAISMGGIVSGAAKILIDYGAYPSYSPDTKWQPTHVLVTPNTRTTIFAINVAGVVYYQDVDEIEWKLITVASIKAARDLLPYLIRLSASEL